MGKLELIAFRSLVIYIFFKRVFNALKENGIFCGGLILGNSKCGTLFEKLSIAEILSMEEL